MLMKPIYLTIIFVIVLTATAAAQPYQGRVLASDTKLPLAGVNIESTNSGRIDVSDSNGYFHIAIQHQADTFIAKHLGYESQEFTLAAMGKSLTLYLTLSSAVLQEVIVNTGYYEIPRERATGSFAHIDQQTLSRSASTNILDRLEGVTNGLQFDRSLVTGENAGSAAPRLRVRGLSTIEAGSDPLVIVDNFPYDGNISTINPNDVESVTVLKDAASASIWGARAGNGVIVINTKKGRRNQPFTVNLVANTSFLESPDLFYSRNFLPSETVMKIQEEFFSKGGYVEDESIYLPLYVEMLIKKRDGLITDEAFDYMRNQYRQADLRQQARSYLYQTGLTQQYAVNGSGGGERYTYYLAGNYDNNKGNVIGNSSRRVNVNMRNEFKINKKISIEAGIWYTSKSAVNNGLTYTAIGNGATEPYLLLADEQGIPLPTGYYSRRFSYSENAIEKGLVNWQYYPLEEMELRNRISDDREVRVTSGFNYRILNWLDVKANYRFLSGQSGGSNYYDPGSFYVRDLINRFTQPDGRQAIPHGGINDVMPNNAYSTHSGRVLLNQEREWSGSHRLSALAGIELSEHRISQTPGLRLYNFSNDFLGGTQAFDFTTWYPVLPRGSARVESGQGSVERRLNRNLSYFSNAAYTYLDRYIISSSVRWDGSNLLGVKTNQRGTVLWSSGVSWRIDEEKFYNKDGIFPRLRLKATYGSGGIIDKSQGHYPTVSFRINSDTGLPYADLLHPGNPSLRWETVNTLNLAAEWGMKGERLSGSVEWYNKDAKDLLGSFMIDPTTGAGPNYRRNYASMRTRGLDLQISSLNIRKAGFHWKSVVMVNYSSNKIVSYDTPESANVFDYFFLNGRPPVVGRSLDAIYAFPWYGLNGNTGLPDLPGYEDGNVDYDEHILNFDPNDLSLMGVGVPPLFGSLRNDFSFKGFDLSAMISFSQGGLFRRTSMVPGGEYLTTPRYHQDYFRRWQEPGDEAFTDVPARVERYHANLADFYTYSEVLVESSDHIRLRDINLSYTIDGKKVGALSFQSLRLTINAQNLGILWRKNRSGVNPLYPNAEFPAQRSVTLGFQLTL